LIDGLPATSFVYGRTAEMCVDVQNFAGGDVVFKLQKTTPSLPLASPVKTHSAVGSTRISVAVPVTLAYQWLVLEKLPTTYSHVNRCCDAGATLPYETNAWYLADQVTDDLFYPPLYFTAAERGQPAVTSQIIRREMPQFVPGNKVELLVNGDQIQTAVLAAIDAATDHVHLDWFFFDCQAKIAQALIRAKGRGVEVRLLFDQLATAAPEWAGGQGINLIDFYQGYNALIAAGVLIGASSLLMAPVDNLRTVTDPEYKDRLEVQKEYVKNLLLHHGGFIAARTLLNGLEAKANKSIPEFIIKQYRSVRDFGSAGIGTPVLGGGCRDHTKLIVIDGKISFCGGANAQHYYIFDHPMDPTRDATAERDDPATTEKWLKWHDCFVRYEGPAVGGAQRYFVERWAVCTGEYLDRTSPRYFPTVPPAGTASIKVINNVPGLERDIAAEYVRMLRNSTQQIQIANPYVTDDLIATYLAHAAQIRHLPVELIVPDKYLDFAIARDLMKARWDSLRAAGIALRAYNNHMLHVKVATADGTTSIVSSYNFAKSSAAQLFEHGVIVNDAAFATEVRQKIFDVDRAVAPLVTTSVAPDWNDVKGGPMRFMDRVI
jgi:phosphatidylserine/phosphatidylglycerophosphate/cardiolipin synthase-like enzyme